MTLKYQVFCLQKLLIQGLFVFCFCFFKFCAWHPKNEEQQVGFLSFEAWVFPAARSIHTMLLSNFTQHNSVFVLNYGFKKKKNDI